MSERRSGPMCSTRCGPGWMDTGTSCLSHSFSPAITGLNDPEIQISSSIPKDAQISIKSNPNYIENRVKSLGTNSLGGNFRFDIEIDEKTLWPKKSFLIERKKFHISNDPFDGKAAIELRGHIFNSESAALSAIEKFKVDPANYVVYAYYKTLDNIIVPTIFSKTTTPAIINTLKRLIENERKDIDATEKALFQTLITLGGLRYVPTAKPLKTTSNAAKSAASGTSTGVITGPYGTVSVSAVQNAANSTGSTLRVITRLDSAPQAARGLSVAIGENAVALANGSRASGNLYAANIPTQFIKLLESVGLVRPITLEMGGVVGTELRFAPAITEFIVHLFKPF